MMWEDAVLNELSISMTIGMGIREMAKSKQYLCSMRVIGVLASVRLGS